MLLLSVEMIRGLTWVDLPAIAPTAARRRSRALNPVALPRAAHPKRAMRRLGHASLSVTTRYWLGVAKRST